jgi:hypothetical protein
MPKSVEKSRHAKPRGPISSLMSSLRAKVVSERQIRAEAWALGGRHHGEVVSGARLELKFPRIGLRRAILLRAVIASYAR